MNGYVSMLITALMVVIAVGAVYLLEKKTAFGSLRYGVRQCLIGLIFGALAVYSTESGIVINGAILNVRDASALCAGLLFGAPAGILAGVIGGVERFLAVYWGAGMYTRWACAISTILAGVFGACLRKYMFNDRKPTWFYGLAAGLVAEVMHMLMIFVTNMSDVRQAFSYVKVFSAPMILLNGAATMLAVMLVSFLSRDGHKGRAEHKPISHTFQRWLLICVAIAFAVTCMFTVSLQTRLSETDSDRLLSLNIADVRSDIQDASDRNLINLTKKISNEIDARPGISDAVLTFLAENFDVAEINIIDTKGVISHSTNNSFVGYNMASGEQSLAFLALLKNKTELAQSYQPISYDRSISRKYAGVRLSGGGFVQVGYDAEQFQRDIASQVVGAAVNRHVGDSGRIIICDKDGFIVSDSIGDEGQKLSASGISIDTDVTPHGKAFRSLVNGEDSLCMYDKTEGYMIIATLPINEAFFSRDVSAYVTMFMEILIFAALFLMIYFLIKRLVVDKIRSINRSLAQITGGNLDVTVNVRSNSEFASLSDDINTTVLTLKQYISEAAARIDQELEFAKAIQHSALPSVFPPYPNRTDFEIFAAMVTAKEVGGDFYDFYFVGEDRLAFLMADVSGKGIPAAMFMMTAKTIIKSLAETGADAAETLTRANQKLCEGNDAGMFVTVWLGVIDLRTGRVEYANAGHNPPLVRSGNGEYEYVRCRAGLVLAGLEGVKYKLQELTLAPGDMLFLYTDGVTEATDERERLYGEDRLKAVLDAHLSANATRLPALVKNDVDAFVGSAPQFDDITMLALRYIGENSEGNYIDNT